MKINSNSACQRFLITGGAGFIGSAVIRFLIENTNHQVSAENKKQFWVPAGFAHGFVVLSDVAEFLYKTTGYYAPKHERCIGWNDKAIGIEWPFNDEPVLSENDLQGKALCDAKLFT